MIAIIAILAAILFPVFARARENARRTSCLSNLKQTGLALKQYTQDYDERFPLALTGNTTGVIGWADSLQPYIKSLQVYQCPSEENGVGDGDPNQPAYTDYWYNAALSWNGQEGSATRYDSGVNESALPFVTYTILAGDGQGDPTGNASSARYRANGRNAGVNGTTTQRFPVTALSDSGLVRNLARSGSRHLAGMNLAFVDGHAKWFKGAEDDAGQLSSKIYMMNTPFSVSGQNPTFSAVGPLEP